MAENRDFSKAEHNQLERGELVSRPITKQSGGMRLFGGTSWMLIQAPAEQVWQALQDIPRYTSMLPKAVEARVLRKHNNQSKIFYDFLVFVSNIYCTR